MADTDTTTQLPEPSGIPVQLTDLAGKLNVTASTLTTLHHEGALAPFTSQDKPRSPIRVDMAHIEALTEHIATVLTQRAARTRRAVDGDALHLIGSLQRHITFLEHALMAHGFIDTNPDAGFTNGAPNDHHPYVVVQSVQTPVGKKIQQILDHLAEHARLNLMGDDTINEIHAVIEKDTAANDARKAGAAAAQRKRGPEMLDQHRGDDAQGEANTTPSDAGSSAPAASTPPKPSTSPSAASPAATDQRPAAPWHDTTTAPTPAWWTVKDVNCDVITLLGGANPIPDAAENVVWDSRTPVGQVTLQVKKSTPSKSQITVQIDAEQAGVKAGDRIDAETPF